jgi:hypothetical protein
MLLLFFAVALTAPPLLTGCTVSPLSILALHTSGVLCEFTIASDLFAAPLEPLIVTVTNDRADAQSLPYYEVTLGNDAKRGSEQIAPSYAVARHTGVHVLTVVFPYATCTVPGAQIVVRVAIGEADRDVRTVLFQQARDCVNTANDDARMSATTITASFLLIYLCVMLVVLCILCIYVNPQAK